MLWGFKKSQNTIFCWGEKSIFFPKTLKNFGSKNLKFLSLKKELNLKFTNSGKSRFSISENQTGEGNKTLFIVNEFY
jgi:hypothetical protein